MGMQQMMMGAAAKPAMGPVYLPPTLSGHVDVNGRCNFRLGNDGNYYIPSIATPTGVWLLSGVNTQYDVRATLLSGHLTTGSLPVNSWMQTSVSRTWYVEDDNAVIRIDIRDGTTLAILTSSQVTLDSSGVR